MSVHTEELNLKLKADSSEVRKARKDVKDLEQSVKSSGRSSRVLPPVVRGSKPTMYPMSSTPVSFGATKDTSGADYSGGRGLAGIDKINWGRMTPYSKFQEKEAKRYYNQLMRFPNAFDKLSRKATMFAMSLLGVMFESQSLARAMQGVLAPAMQAVGVFDIWSMLLTVAFLPAAMVALDVVLWLWDAFDSLSESAQESVAYVALATFVLAQMVAVGTPVVIMLLSIVSAGLTLAGMVAGLLPGLGALLPLFGVLALSATLLAIPIAFAAVGVTILAACLAALLNADSFSKFGAGIMNTWETSIKPALESFVTQTVPLAASMGLTYISEFAKAAGSEESRKKVLDTFDSLLTFLKDKVVPGILDMGTEGITKLATWIATPEAGKRMETAMVGMWEFLTSSGLILNKLNGFGEAVVIGIANWIQKPESITKIVNAIIAVFNGLTAVQTSINNSLGTILTTSINSMVGDKDLSAAVVGLGTWVGVGFLNAMANPLNPLAGVISGLLPNLPAYIGSQAVPGYATGGFVPNTGLAMLHAGEYVVPAKEVRSVESQSRGGVLIFSPTITVQNDVASDVDVSSMINRLKGELMDELARASGTVI